MPLLQIAGKGSQTQLGEDKAADSDAVGDDDDGVDRVLLVLRRAKAGRAISGLQDRVGRHVLFAKLPTSVPHSWETRLVTAKQSRRPQSPQSRLAGKHP